MQQEVGDGRLFGMWVNWLVGRINELLNWFMNLKIGGVSVAAVAIIGLVVSLVVFFIEKKGEGE